MPLLKNIICKKLEHGTKLHANVTQNALKTANSIHWHKTNGKIFKTVDWVCLEHVNQKQYKNWPAGGGSNAAAYHSDQEEVLPLKNIAHEL